MKMLSDFFPIILFFIAYKLFGIYVATAVAIAASLIQVLVYWLYYKKIDKMQLMTLVLIVIFGGATLLLHEEIYIKWKPTILNWLFALVFLGSHFIGNKTLVQRAMEKNVMMPPKLWIRLNASWVGFFFLMGCINLVIVYHFSTDVWVNFKLFGMLGLTVLFVLIQAIFLGKHINPTEQYSKGEHDE